MTEKREPTGCDGRLMKEEFSNQSAYYSAPAFQSPHENDQPRKSGGRKSRDKGNRAERALVRAYPIAKAMGMDATIKAHRGKISAMLKMWTANRMFVAVDGLDDQRKKRSFIEVGEPAND